MKIQGYNEDSIVRCNLGKWEDFYGKIEKEETVILIPERRLDQSKQSDNWKTVIPLFVTAINGVILAGHCLLFLVKLLIEHDILQ